MPRPAPWLSLPLVAGLATLACGGGGGDPSGPTIRTPSAIALVAGGGQSGAAGGTLATPVSVRVSDAQGPLAGIAVQFTVTAGGGSAQPAAAFTDQAGVASSSWRLGTEAEVGNVLRVTATGLDQAVTLSATPTAGPAALVTPVTGSGQLAVVSRPVTDPPTARVTDQYGNPVAGEPVTFVVRSGGGTVTGAVVVSGPTGLAPAGSWVLGPAPGLNTLRASIAAGSAADFLATGTAASLQFTTGAGQAVNSGTAVPVVPTVLARDGDGNPLPGVPVTFSASQGAGQVTGTVVLTDAAGTARPSAWILGPVPGPNQLQAAAPGVAPVSVSATGLQAVPATLTFEMSGPLTGFEGNFLTERPLARLRDASGNPVAGEAVVFDVTAGGGQVFGPATVTDANGYARAQAWRMGPTGATHTLRATAAGLPAVTVSATAAPPPPPGAFTIDVRYVGLQPTPAQRAAFDNAIERWQRVILGDLSDEPAEPLPAVGTLCEAINEDIDDLVIFVRLQEIDGVNGVLGSAGPCWIRDVGALTAVGGMRFDVADLAALEASGQLTSVVLHEMGHVLGVGSLWNPLGLLSGGGGVDPLFTGPAAHTVFETIFQGGAAYLGARVPVENIGGPGSRDGHWREAALRNELMTSILNTGTNPLSALSLASLRDMGYLVNDAVAEAFEILPSLGGGPAAGPRVLLPPVATEPVRRLPRRPARR